MILFTRYGLYNACVSKLHYGNQYYSTIMVKRGRYRYNVCGRYGGDGRFYGQIDESIAINMYLKYIYSGTRDYEWYIKHGRITSAYTAILIGIHNVRCDHIVDVYYKCAKYDPNLCNVYKSICGSHMMLM